MWILFSHGAGLGSQSPWMKRYRRHLRKIAPVVTFDYDYMRAGRKRPDRHERLLSTHREALRRGQAKHGTEVVLAGKSMGSRIGCHLALEEENVRGLVCFGYPLVGMGKSRNVRDEVLLELDRPICFVQGTRDNLCPLPQLEKLIERRQAPSKLVVVESGNHSLEVTTTFLKQNGTTQEQVEQEIFRDVAEFLGELG